MLYTFNCYSEDDNDGDNGYLGTITVNANTLKSAFRLIREFENSKYNFSLAKYNFQVKARSPEQFYTSFV